MRAVRTLVALPVLAVLCLAVMLAWAARGDSAGNADSGHTYTMAEMQTLLAHHSDAWYGRTIRVRGVVTGCPYRLPGTCASWQPELRFPETRPSKVGAGLLLVPVPARPDGLTALLRRIPLVRALVGGPQVVQWDVAATYQVRLQAVDGSHCGGGPCYEALLLDAAPGALGEG
jgi:hypothetical protein